MVVPSHECGWGADAENGNRKNGSPISLEFLERLAKSIQNDLGGGCAQEEPAERLSKETKRMLREVRSHVMQHVVKNKLSARCLVPSSWEQTLYGRLKVFGYFTKPHCDAINTLFERQLLSKENLSSKEAERVAAPERLVSEWDRLCSDDAAESDEAFGRLSRTPIQSLPVYTFWVCLRSLTSRAQSHLRLIPKSHREGGLRVDRDAETRAARAIKPTKRKPWQAHEFAIPKWRAGENYNAGDVVIFHCLTRHRGTPHGWTTLKGKGKRKKRRVHADHRLSMDGRFFMLPDPLVT